MLTGANRRGMKNAYVKMYEKNLNIIITGGYNIYTNIFS